MVRALVLVMNANKENTMKTTYCVMNYDTAEILPGDPSPELVEESLENNAVRASLDDDGVWHPDRDGTVTVYVMED